jgi:transcriptional regulator with XRE-family HTH domain
MKSARELFGERIKELRIRGEMTQEDVAKTMEIDPKSFSRIERGERFPSLEALEKIACALSVEIKDLFEFEHLQGIEVIRDVCGKMIKEANEEELKIFLKMMRSVMR